MKSITELLGNEHLNEGVNKTLVKIIKTASSLNKAIVEHIQKTIVNSKATPYFAFKSLSEVLKVIPANEALGLLKALLDHPVTDVKLLAVKGLLEEVVKVIPEEILKEWKVLLNNSDGKVIREVEGGLLRVVKVAPSLAKKAFIELQEVFNNYIYDNKIKFNLLSNFKEIVKADSSLAKEVFKELNRLFDDPNNKESIKHCYVWDDIVDTIKEIVRVEPNLAEEAFIRLKNLFNNSHFRIPPYLREEIDIGDILKQATKKIPLEKAFKLWADLLYSEHKTKNYCNS